MGAALADGIDLDLEAPEFKDPSEWAPEGTEWGRRETCRLHNNNESKDGIELELSF